MRFLPVCFLVLALSASRVPGERFGVTNVPRQFGGNELAIGDFVGDLLQTGFVGIVALEHPPEDFNLFYGLTADQFVYDAVISGPDVPAPGIFFAQGEFEATEDFLMGKRLYLIVGNDTSYRTSTAFVVFDVEDAISGVPAAGETLWVDGSLCVVWGEMRTRSVDLHLLGGPRDHQMSVLAFPPLTPRMVPDWDGDGLSYFAEVAMGTDPCKGDSDGDGVLDGAEDFDQDGLDNQSEWVFGTDANDANSKFEFVIKHAAETHSICIPMDEERCYVVQQSENLIDWEDVVSVTMYDQEGDEVDLGPPPAGQVFYRVVVERYLF